MSHPAEESQAADEAIVLRAGGGPDDTARGGAGPGEPAVGGTERVARLHADGRTLSYRQAGGPPPSGVGFGSRTGSPVWTAEELVAQGSIKVNGWNVDTTAAPIGRVTANPRFCPRPCCGCARGAWGPRWVLLSSLPLALSALRPFRPLLLCWRHRCCCFAPPRLALVLLHPCPLSRDYPRR